MASEYDTDFERLAEYSADVICRSGVDMKWRYVSPSSLAVLGWTPEEMIRMEAFALVYPEDLPCLMAIATRNFAPGVEPERVAVRMRKKDGNLVWIEFTARLVRDPVTGEAKEAVVTMRDISERKLLEEKLSALALTDGLTELANRRAFDEALDREWKRTLREGSQISLLLLDLDRFKEFNDQYGHQVGDDCLRAVARAVRGLCARPTSLRVMAGRRSPSFFLLRIRLERSRWRRKCDLRSRHSKLPMRVIPRGEVGCLRASASQRHFQEMVEPCGCPRACCWRPIMPFTKRNAKAGTG